MGYHIMCRDCWLFTVMELYRDPGDRETSLASYNEAVMLLMEMHLEWKLNWLPRDKPLPKPFLGCLIFYRAGMSKSHIVLFKMLNIYGHGFDLWPAFKQKRLSWNVQNIPYIFFLRVHHCRTPVKNPGHPSFQTLSSFTCTMKYQQNL